MVYPIAEKFENGTYVKPVCKNSDFFVGGFFAIQKRFGVVVSPFRGAFNEYKKRVEGKPQYIAIETMRDYIQLV